MYRGKMLTTLHIRNIEKVTYMQILFNTTGRLFSCWSKYNGCTFVEPFFQVVNEKLYLIAKNWKELVFHCFLPIFFCLFHQSGYIYWQMNLQGSSNCVSERLEISDAAVMVYITCSTSSAPITVDDSRCHHCWGRD